MPRLPRFLTVVPGLAHHVTLRGNNKRRLFSYPWERVLFLRYLEQGLALHDILLFALVLMTNHVHLLCTVPSVPALSAAMKHTCQRYAQHRNWRRMATGKLFEARFDALPIESERHFGAVTCYIELNPERAGMCSAADHPWSTYGFHAGRPMLSKVPPEMWTPSPWYLSLGVDAATRSASYGALVSDQRERFEMGETLREAPEPLFRVRRPNGRSAR